MKFAESIYLSLKATPSSSNFSIFFEAALFLALLTTLGCASTYKPVNLPSFDYRVKKEARDSVFAGYAYDLQYQTKNNRYSNKEKKYGMAAVAVKIENLSGHSVVITKENFATLAGQEKKLYITPVDYSQKVKQKSGIHLLHGLWGPWAMSWKTNDQGKTEFRFIYIPVGAIVGIGNAIRASNANKAHLEMLNTSEIWDREIKPGEVLYGVILIPSAGYEELNFRLMY